MAAASAAEIDDDVPFLLGLRLILCSRRGFLFRLSLSREGRHRLLYRLRSSGPSIPSVRPLHRFSELVVFLYYQREIFSPTSSSFTTLRLSVANAIAGAHRRHNARRRVSLCSVRLPLFSSSFSYSQKKLIYAPLLLPPESLLTSIAFPQRIIKLRSPRKAWGEIYRSDNRRFRHSLRRAPDTGARKAKAYCCGINSGVRREGRGQSRNIDGITIPKFKNEFEEKEMTAPIASGSFRAMRWR